MADSLLFNGKKPAHPWAMLTAYDFPTAKLVDEAGVDFVLVGDSLSMVVLGYPSTREVSMEEMLHHAKAVRRGVKRAAVVGDLPLSGVRRGPLHAVDSARRFVEEAGVDAVKLEWSEHALRSVKLMRRRGIAVMGHVGLTPQSTGPEGYKVRGKNADEAARILEQAKAFEAEGAFSVLLEMVPAPVAATVTRALGVPTVGIGAGPDCDGQVLVLQDLTGAPGGIERKFMKRYADVTPLIDAAVRRYAADVRAGRFPSAKQSFALPEPEKKRFRARVAAKAGGRR